MNWDLFRYFLSVSKTGSLSMTADELGVSQPTVTRRISMLEDHLGVQLFNRCSTGMSLSSAGTELVNYAEKICSIAELVETNLCASRENRRVSVSMPECISEPLLPEITRRLSGNASEICLDLQIAESLSDHIHQRSDISFYLGGATYRSGFECRPLGVVKYGLFASRDYLLAHDQPLSITDLSTHATVDTLNPDRHTVNGAHSGDTSRLGTVVFRSDSILTRYRAVVNGVGIGSFPSFFPRHMEAGTKQNDLTQILERGYSTSCPLWLMVSSEMENSLAHRGYIEAVLAAIESLDLCQSYNRSLN